jgi:hypothetical protein
LFAQCRKCAVPPTSVPRPTCPQWKCVPEAKQENERRQPGHSKFDEASASLPKTPASGDIALQDPAVGGNGGMNEIKPEWRSVAIHKLIAERAYELWEIGESRMDAN